MRFVEEYRDAEKVSHMKAAIAATASRPCTIMEVCGGQTHAIVRYGLDRLLPETVSLVHGPGCPVCVTALETLDRAHAIASRQDVVFCSFGDMLRVPGSSGDLLQLKARGGDIRVVYSPLDAVELAARLPDRRVVFFAIGFETTAPANAVAIQLARRRRLTNFSALVSHVLTPPALTSILQSPDNHVRAFLGPGHVCSVMGYREYEHVSERYRVPIVITGFEPLDILEGILLAVRQLERGEAFVENQYRRSVQREGNARARAIVDEVFEVCDRQWRGVGAIPKSGLRLSYEYRDFDAERIFEVGTLLTQESPLCISGQVLRGRKKPSECPAFGRECTPDSPLGATMVSSEGACSAYYTYGRYLEAAALNRSRRSGDLEMPS